jgi:HPt (histidine-containing phosphotransfer) domain-containing protein
MPRPRPSVRVSGELRDLVGRFLVHAGDELAQLRAAAARRDHDELRRIGHILKGAGGGYGFDEITRLGAEIERRAAHGQDVGRLVDALGDYLQSVEVTFV